MLELGPAVSLEVLLLCGIATVGGRDVGGARITKAEPSARVRCFAAEDDRSGSLDRRSGSAFPVDVIVRPMAFDSGMMRYGANPFAANFRDASFVLRQNSIISLRMAAKNLRWGIVGCGWISTKFALDLLIPATTRDVHDVTHTIVAVASRSAAKADEFVKELYSQAGLSEPTDAAVRRYGSYEELYADDHIDCVYIGTPHSHHYANAHAALSAGKGVLVEKPMAVTAAQATILTELAQSKNKFLMEGVWTRFQPVSYAVQALLGPDSLLGEIRGVQAELCIDFEVDTLPKNHRMVDLDLAGGALLDLGPYPWVWIALILFPEPSSSTTPHKIPKISASVIKSTSGADASTIAVIQVPRADGKVVHATLNCSMVRRTNQQRSVLVECEKGFLEIEWATYRPEAINYKAYSSAKAMGNLETPVEAERISFADRPGKIWGFGWEADECARCIFDGKVQSERMPWRDSILMMEVFDEIRKQGEVVYPESIETTDL